MEKLLRSKLLHSFVLLLFTSAVCSYAQQTTLSTGDTAQSAAGSMSYSVGQVAYQSYENAAVKVTEGIQQPYEIFVLSTTENATNKKITVYPNPVKDFLIVDFNSEKLQKGSYQFFDISGKTIKRGELKDLKNEINTSSFSAGAYILSILENGTIIKNYKIIKN